MQPPKGEGEALAPLLRYYPVFIRRANVVVAFSPKSGCSHAVLWSFLHDGLFHAANDYDRWPHNYRLNVYHQSPAFRRPVRQLLDARGGGLTLLKITRKPANRLVSIFRHACRFPFLRGQVREALGFDMNNRGLSLADLDAVLGRLRLVVPTEADPHVRAQYHPLWDLPFDRVVTLNLDEVPLDSSLNAVEREFGLPVTDFAALPQFQQLRETHYATPRTAEIRGPIETRRFRRHETAEFPKAALMSSALLESMARRHYAIDQGRVASGDTAGVLFAPAVLEAAARK